MQVVWPSDQVMVLVSTWQSLQTGGEVGLAGVYPVTVLVTVTAAGHSEVGGGTGVLLGGADVHVSVQVETQVVGR
jgi:hypothetical protein